MNVPSGWKKIMTSEQISICIRKIANQLNEKFRNYERPIVVVGILKGVYLFMSDLTKLLTFDHSVYFIDASSYKGQVQDTVQIVNEVESSKFVGKTVILLDELFDRGVTMQTLKNYLIEKVGVEKDQCFTCVLYSKKTENQLPLPDFIGYKDLPSVWLVGYGLDDHGVKRNLLDLYALPKADGLEKTEDDQIFENEAYYEKVLSQVSSQF